MSRRMFRATPTGVLDNPETRIEFAAKGRIEGLVAPEGVAVPPELGRDIDWSLAATAARDGRTVDLTRLSAEGAGIALAGSGQLTEGGSDRGTRCVCRSPIFAPSPASSVIRSPARSSSKRMPRGKGAAGFKATAARLGEGAADRDRGRRRAARRRGDDDRLHRNATPRDVLIVDRLAIAGRGSKPLRRRAV